MVARAVKTNTHLSTIRFWWNDVKFYLAIGLICGICGSIGFAAGSIQVKKRFDQVAIDSGHAQYHPTRGILEWRSCR